MNVYERIDQLLKDEGISRRKAAMMAGIPPTTLNTALSTQKGLSAAAVAELARALEIDASYLLHGTMTLESGLVVDIDRSMAEVESGEVALEAAKLVARARQGQLLMYFSKLNEDGQEKAVEAVKMLAEHPRYGKG